jgi:ketosteroid isomerase-like protein
MLFQSATSAPTAFGHQPSPADHDRETRHLEIARRYLAAIEGEGDAAPGEWPAGAYYHPDVEQVELPNRLVPSGATRDLRTLREAAQRGRGVVRAQRYAVRAAHACGDTVILELTWIGTLAVAVGSLAIGDEMRAHFAVFLEFRDGLIHRQRNYDCFEPF